MLGLKFKGRPPILLADSVKNVARLEDPYAKVIVDRTVPLDEELVYAVLAQSVFGWEGRNPSPALDPEGNFKGTDLDLLSFMVPMADRSAVIEISRYRNRRKIVVKVNERKIGTNQFGRVLSLVSHKDVLSFSVKIFDGTIVVKDLESGKEQIGAPRNYMLVDCDSHWYDGWDRIVFDPTAAENRFLTEKGLWTGNTVYFKHYVHPNRWQSVFGAPYLLLKMLIARINDEASFYRSEMKRLEASGIVLPEEEKKSYVPSEYEGATMPIKVETIEMVLDLPDFQGKYQSVADKTEGLVQAYQRQKFLTYTLRPQVQFIARADEAAYFKFGKERVAHWMTGRSWKSGYKPPKGRVEWNRMMLSNDMALRYRIKEITQQVSAE